MTETVTLLVENLTSNDASDRRQAALALGAVQDDAVVAPLLQQMRLERNARVLEDLTWALVQHAAAADDELVAMLLDDDPAQRRIAAHVLSKVRNPRHFERVQPLVADADADVAIKAYRAAANTGGPMAVAVLAEQLGQGDQLRRDALSSALASIGAAVVPALTQALGSNDAGVREHAAEALGQLGGPEAGAAAPALEAAAADAEPAVRLAAVSALGQLAGEADEPLRRLAGGGDRLVAQVATRLLAGRGA